MKGDKKMETLEMLNVELGETESTQLESIHDSTREKKKMG